MIAEKYDELVSYLSSLAYRSDIYPEYREDVIHNVIARLLEEDAVKPFPTARLLWGRATNLMRDETGKHFADSLPVSGVGRQAHYYARKYLLQNGGNPELAYHNQTETPKVGRDLLRIVANGTGQTDPAQLAELDLAGAESLSGGLSEDREARVREAVSNLSWPHSDVVRLHLGMDGDPKPLNEVATLLGLTLSQVKSLWRSAKRLLAQSLHDVSQ